MTKAAIERAIMYLGNNLEGLWVVDYGCGRGRNMVRFIDRGARVLAFDLSRRMAKSALELVQTQGLVGKGFIQQMAGEQLAYKDGSVDRIFGVSILHHLDWRAACSEIRRVLKPGGRAAFVEPLAHNPVVWFYRLLTPHKRSPLEQPLSFRDIRIMREMLPNLISEEYYLTAVLALPFGLIIRRRDLFLWLLSIFERLDSFLLGKLSWLRRLAWIVVLLWEKPECQG
ncbi:MAG: class I SAM-dependent methyltransferase [Candidatus Methanomethylicia archaeon]|nr:class I SAM-dependent methyltransferase [Candidatus Methanomethylicia archaeon]